MIVAALSLSHADLLEPHGNRLAICHRFHCHAMSATTNWNRMLLAALACCIPLMTSLSVASASPPAGCRLVHCHQDSAEPLFRLRASEGGGEV